MAGTASTNQGAREVYGGVAIFTPSGDSAMDETNDALRVNVVAGGASGGGTQYAEDTASSAGDQLTMAGVVRRDTAATLVDTDGDRTQLQVDAAGRLWVNASGAAVPVTDNGSTLSVDDGGGSITVDGTLAVEDGGGSLTVDNAALSVTGGGVEASALRVTLASDSTGVLSVDDNGATLSVDDGGGSLTVDNAALSVTGGGTETGALRVTIASNSTGVLSVDDNGSTLSVDDGGASLTVDGTVAVSGLAGSTTASAPTTQTIGTTSGTVVASNANRKGLALTNTSTSGQRISLHMAGGAAVLDSGRTLWPGDIFEMDPWSFTTAQINGIASAASATLGIQEMT